MGIVCPFFVPKNISDMHIFEAIKDKESSGMTDRQNGSSAWEIAVLRTTLGGEINRCTF
jgi:hypothetical protein